MRSQLDYGWLNRLGGGGCRRFCFVRRQKWNAARALIPITSPPTLAVNELAFFTSTIGKIDRTTYSSVIENPKPAATLTARDGFSPGATNGIANMTKYVSAQHIMPELLSIW